MEEMNVGISRRAFIKAGACTLGARAAAAASKERKYQIGAYYFPNFHVDPRNEAAHGKKWTEWEIL